MKKEWVEEQVKFVKDWNEKLKKEGLSESQKQVILGNILDCVNEVKEAMDCYNKLNFIGLLTNKTLYKYMDLAQMFYNETYDIRKQLNI